MYQRVKGTSDLYPRQKEVQRRVFALLRQSARKYGFSEVEVPIMESFNLLSAKSGPEIKEQIFTLEPKATKKGAEKEEIALIPEFTPGITRMFAAKQREMPKPVKWFALNRLWRYEAPQKGREREFSQMSVELYGSEQPSADAEVINLCADCLKNLGLKTKDFVIKISNKKLLSGILADILPRARNGMSAVMRIIDKSRKLSKEELEQQLADEKLDMLARQKIKKLVALRGNPEKIIGKLKKMKLNAEAMQGLAELENLVPYLQKDIAEIDLSIARGLAYYTGTVFECYDRAENYRAIAGGGRYDSLVKLYGGENCAATGFGLGYSTLTLLLSEKELLPKLDIGPDFYVAPVNAAMAKKARDIAQKLRKNYSVEVDLMARKLGKQFNYASAIGAKKVIIVGPKEMKLRKVVVRDMRTGKEKKVSLIKLF